MVKCQTVCVRVCVVSSVVSEPGRRSSTEQTSTLAPPQHAHNSSLRRRTDRQRPARARRAEDHTSGTFVPLNKREIH